MKTLILLFTLILTACGGASGNGSNGSNIIPQATSDGITTHAYLLTVTANDSDFTFAPALIGTNGNENNPGPRTVTGVGNTLSFNLTDSHANIQITGISSSNNAFSATARVYKDNALMQTWQINVGTSQQVNL